jgi:hypothetical protein
MTLTIIEATLANPDGSAAIIQTAERGAVAISLQDRPELWRLFLLWQKAGVVEPFAAADGPAEGAPASAEKKLRAFLRRNRDVVEHLRARGIPPGDLGV